MFCGTCTIDPLTLPQTVNQSTSPCSKIIFRHDLEILGNISVQNVPVLWSFNKRESHYLLLTVGGITIKMSSHHYWHPRNYQCSIVQPDQLFKSCRCRNRSEARHPAESDLPPDTVCKTLLGWQWGNARSPADHSCTARVSLLTQAALKMAAVWMRLSSISSWLWVNQEGNSSQATAHQRTLWSLLWSHRRPQININWCWEAIYLMKDALLPCVQLVCCTM